MDRKVIEMVDLLYNKDNGRPSIGPVVLFKMVLIQHLYGLSSLRQTTEEVGLNIAYRWFLGYTLQEETPHFSTVSYNFRHRFTEETIDRVFAWILEEVAQAGYLSPQGGICRRHAYQSQRQYQKAQRQYLQEKIGPTEEGETAYRNPKHNRSGQRIICKGRP